MEQLRLSHAESVTMAYVMKSEGLLGLPHGTAPGRPWYGCPLHGRTCVHTCAAVSAAELFPLRLARW
eukprot:1859973-Amphidinium_carterae.4